MYIEKATKYGFSIFEIKNIINKTLFKYFYIKLNH